MPVIPYVFSGNKCIDDVGGKILVISPGPVFYAYFSQKHPVFGVDLGSQVVLGIFKLGERRHRTKFSPGYQNEQDNNYNERYCED